MVRRPQNASPVTRGPGQAAMLSAALLLAGLAPAIAAPGEAARFKSVPPESLVEGVPIEAEVARQQELHAWLMRELPEGVLASPVVVSLSEAERRAMKQAQAEEVGRAIVGRTTALALRVGFTGLDAALLSDAPRRAAGGFLRAMPDGGFVWAAAIRAAGAGALRLHVEGLNLPADADLYFFSPAGQAFGPYSGRGPTGDGDFWTHTVFGTDGIVVLRHYGPGGAGDLQRIHFRLSETGHIGEAFAQSPGASIESFCSFNASCVENASCYNVAAANPAKSAVALMQWISGPYIYTCTGGLLADTDPGSQIPYFLTANHCISQGNLASNMEAYFQFTLPCGQTNCPAQTNPGGVQRLGATIKATGSAGDFTLMQLNQTPPSGSIFLGWNNAPVAFTNNVNLHRISHPAWAPQAYSRQHTDTSAPTCSTWPRGQRIYSRTDVGGTQGGSSGSPVVNGNSQVVGQLSGKCGTNVNNDCDHASNATVDGALAYYWPSVAPYLDPVPCTPVAEICDDADDNDCDGQIDCADSDCNGSPSCTSTCSPAGASCSANSDCCSNKCRGRAGSKTCR